METWGQAVKRRRKKLGVSPETLAAEARTMGLRLSIGSVRNAERGQNVRIETESAIEAALGQMEEAKAAATAAKEARAAETAAKVRSIRPTVAVDEPSQVSPSQEAALGLLNRIVGQLEELAELVRDNRAALADLQARPVPAVRKSRQQ